MGVAERRRSEGLHDFQQILGSGRHICVVESEGQTPVQSDAKNLCVGTYRDLGVIESNP